MQIYAKRCPLCPEFCLHCAEVNSCTKCFFGLQFLDGKCGCPRGYYLDNEAPVIEEPLYESQNSEIESSSSVPEVNATVQFAFDGNANTVYDNPAGASSGLMIFSEKLSAYLSKQN